MTAQPTMMHEAYHRQLNELRTEDRYRSLAARQGTDFCSNDYLGLAASPRIKAAIGDAIDRGVPVGSGGSRLLRGNHEEHDTLEQEAARFFGTESALYFSTGFAANAALFGTVPQSGDLVVYDALIHASVHEGLKLGRAASVAAAHNDVDAFDDSIRKWRSEGGTGRAWIAIESLYSMDGDIAPVDELAALARQHDAFLVIDEAHATGVFGPQGRGLCAHLSGQHNIISLHTCGKGMGCEGALLTGPSIICDFLINRGRGFIFSTAPSPLMASAVREALRILADEPERRTQLSALIADARKRFEPLGASPGTSQIVPIIVGENARAMTVAKAVQSAGYDVRAIRPPTVPHGTARLRISVTLNATHEDIAGLAETVEAALK